MADPLSITASALTIISAIGALRSGVQKLRELPRAAAECQDILNKVGSLSTDLNPISLIDIEGILTSNHIAARCPRDRFTCPTSYH